MLSHTVGMDRTELTYLSVVTALLKGFSIHSSLSAFVFKGQNILKEYKVLKKTR